MPRLARKDGSALGMPRALLVSASWAVGVGAGVALGAVLTAVGGAGAPGLSGLDAGPDLTVAPWVVGGAVFLLHIAGTIGLALVRGGRSSQGPAQHHQDDEQRSEQRVEREVETEVPASDR